MGVETNDKPEIGVNVFFSAGEASGDRYAAELAERIQKKISCRIWGIGGPKLQSQTSHEVISSANWGALGVLESLKIVPRVFRGYVRGKRGLKSMSPGVFVPIDYGFLNISLSKFAKSKGWKVFYFIPPGSWRKNKQGSDLPIVTDLIITPFSWSAEILNKMGANAHFFGHPLKQMVLEAKEDSIKRAGIAILPGSRKHEIETNLPEIAKALLDFPDEPITFAVASNLQPQDLKQLWQAVSNIPAQFNTNTYQVLQSARAAIVCSGTATLESALCNCPTVVVYRATKAMVLEFKILKPKFDYISLPNILLNRKLVPEYIHDDANAKTISHELSLLLAESEERKNQLQGFQELSEILGPSDAISQSVALILKEIQK